MLQLVEVGLAEAKVDGLWDKMVQRATDVYDAAKAGSPGAPRMYTILTAEDVARFCLEDTNTKAAIGPLSRATKMPERRTRRRHFQRNVPIVG